MTDTITLKREDADRLLLILEHRWDNHFLIDALKAALAAPEPLVRYCPDCGSIGPVPATARDCCPDGGHARMVPENFAKSCRDTFLRAIGEPQPVKQAPIKSFKELDYKVGWQRYEKVRKLNVHQFSELFQRGLKGERFDEMVDGLGAKAMTDLKTLAKQAGDVETDSRGRETFSFDSYGLQAFADLIRKDEREQCAVIAEKTICDTHIPTGIDIYGTRAGKAIRARTTTC